MGEKEKNLIRAWANLGNSNSGPRRGRQDKNTDMTIGPPRDKKVKVKK